MRKTLSAACMMVASLMASAAPAQTARPADPLAERAINLLWTADIPGFRKLVESQPAVLNMRGVDGSTPFMYAAIYGDADMLKWLLARGADPNRRNDANASALMWAVDDAAMASVLIDAGADVNARSSDGLTPVAIAASQVGSDAVVRLLLDAGAVKDSEGRPSRLRCRGASRAIDVRADDRLDLATRWRDRMLQGLAPGDGPATVAAILVGLHAQNYKRDLLTDAMVRYLKRSQQLDGRWIGAPQQSGCSGDITHTALAARALQLYAPPQFQPAYDQAVLGALRWLTRAEAENTDDRAYRLMGLVWSGATKYGVMPARKELVSEQRADGGWSDPDAKESSARATELALAALRTSGVVPEEPSYKKAMQYLRTVSRTSVVTPES